MRTRCWACLGLLLLFGSAMGQKKEDDLASVLQKLDGTILATDKEKAAEVRQALGRNLRQQLQESNERESAAWAKIQTKADWERYRDARLEKLRESLGVDFKATDKPVVQVSKTLKGEGYTIDNLVYESLPGVWVTGNLYLPAKPGKSMPGMILCHSHHSPKAQGELQEMGITWARLGCAVLVIDQFGHGERRQHPFVDDKSFPKAYQRSRQDYYFRYNSELQLSLIGASLMGVMVADMRRGVDVLLAHARADPEKIVLLGSVAGGGDPAAVTAALEPRIKAVVPFNFGGPQPETRYPLPEDAAKTFNYVGGGGWEATRNLRLSARDGFQPWVIVGAVAPRGLIYGHEFSWDRERDPVWARLEKIYGFYDAKEKLAFAHGTGTITGKNPEGSHCNNIGRIHRKLVYPALEKWFQIAVPEKEADTRHTAAELACATPENEKQIAAMLKKLTTARAEEQRATAERALNNLRAEDRRGALIRQWNRQLALPAELAKFETRQAGSREEGGVKYEWLVIEGPVPVPVLLLIPTGSNKDRRVVIAVSQDGKQKFLKERSATIAALLEKGIAVCLPDLRGTGETSSGEDRGRRSAATSYSSSAHMLGQTLLGQRVLDLERVVHVLATRADFDYKRIAVWGESFAPVNGPKEEVGVPLELQQPHACEPLGTLVALFASLRGNQIRAILGRGGLVSYQSVLPSPFLHVPHDVLIPGALATGDIPLLLAHVPAPQIRLEGLVDGLNRRVHAKDAAKVLKPGKHVELGDDYSDAKAIASWFADQLK